jgi:transcriptional regulator with XRE-family HTH domain|tara:strand:- start:3415 stop:3627 length:213 start_codon:yes stop_codon:yes gene_type:complete
MKIDPCIPFGLNLRTLREHKGISQEKLAELSLLDRTYISSVERGKRNLGLRNIIKIAQALEIHPSKLLTF